MIVAPDEIYKSARIIDENGRPNHLAAFVTFVIWSAMIIPPLVDLICDSLCEFEVGYEVEYEKARVVGERKDLKLRDVGTTYPGAGCNFPGNTTLPKSSRIFEAHGLSVVVAEDPDGGSSGNWPARRPALASFPTG